MISKYDKEYVDTRNGPITVRDFPEFGIAYDPTHQRIHVVAAGSDTVSAIDTSMAATIPIAIADVSGIANDPVNDRMYVTERIIFASRTFYERLKIRKGKGHAKAIVATAKEILVVI